MSAASPEHPPARNVPVVGPMSPPARVFLLVTLVVSVVGIVLRFALDADPTLLCVVSGAGILGLAWPVGLSTERLGLP